MPNIDFGDKFKKAIGGLKGEDKKELSALIDSMLKAEEENRSPRQIRDIVPIKDWISSKYYFGDFSGDLYPFWKDEIVDFFEGGYNEWVITGSIRSGKSFAVDCACMRLLYELSCYENPQALLGLSMATSLMMAYFTISMRQAFITEFAIMRNMVDNIPYFIEHFKRDDSINTLMKFKNILFIPASEDSHIIGTALISAILDESNFLKTSGGSKGPSFTKAKGLYVDTSNRINSQARSGNKHFGRIFLISSSTTQTSFTEDRIKNKGVSTKITVAKLWKVKPKGVSLDKFFYVFKGSDRQDAFIVKDAIDYLNIVSNSACDIVNSYMHNNTMDSDLKIETIYNNLSDHDKNSFEKVPDSFRRAFETDIYSALQDIAGVSIAVSGKLFSSNSIWWGNVDNSLHHPFRRETFIISTADNIPLSNYLEVDKLIKNGEMLRHPSEKRFIHIDQSRTSDCTAISCCHIAGYKEDTMTNAVLPIVEIDFMIRIEPPQKPAKISLTKIVQFIVFLRDLGVPLGCVTYDQFQSDIAIEVLTTAGIKAERLSLGRSDKPYIDFISLLNENRIKMYDYKFFKEEFFDLEHDRSEGIVDHTDTGSKDICDAVIGSITSLMKGVPSRSKLLETSKNILNSFVDPDSLLPDISWVYSDWGPIREGKKKIVDDKKYLNKEEFKRKE